MISSKSYGLQNETRQYLRRLYAYGKELAGTDVNDVDNFVKGLKQLDLWSNMKIWLMRSRYNIGTGSKVLCLGSDPSDGTILNSGTWEDNGIRKVTSTGDHLSTTVKTLGNAPLSVGGVVKSDTDLGNNAGYLFTSGINTNGRQFATTNTSGATSRGFSCIINNWQNGSISRGDMGSSSRTSRWFFSVRLTSGLTGNFSHNATQGAQTSAPRDWNTSNPVFTRFGLYTVPVNVVNSLFFLRTTTVITNEQDSAFYNLLKTTIEKGTGLP